MSCWFSSTCHAALDKDTCTSFLILSCPFWCQPVYASQVVRHKLWFQIERCAYALGVCMISSNYNMKCWAPFWRLHTSLAIIANILGTLLKCALLVGASTSPGSTPCPCVDSSGMTWCLRSTRNQCLILLPMIWCTLVQLEHNDDQARLKF